MSAGTVRHMEYIRVRLVWCMCTVHRIVLMQFKVTNHAFTFSLHFIEKYRQCTCRYIPQYSPIRHTISLSLLFPVIPFFKLASSPLPRFAQDPFSCMKQIKIPPYMNRSHDLPPSFSHNGNKITLFHHLSNQT